MDIILLLILNILKRVSYIIINKLYDDYLKMIFLNQINNLYKIDENGISNNKIKIHIFIYILIIWILINFKYSYISKLFLSKKIELKNKDVVLLMIPRHGNLGDQAITLAELKFLKEIFSNISIIYNIENYRNYIHDNTLILLHGGGNVGWIYSYEEENRRKIIKSFPNNNIVILPQTIYFEKKFEEQQKITSDIYSNHSKLTIIVRDKISLNIANNIFAKNKVILSPDLVTYLDDLIELNNITRKGALFLLRRDGEKSLDIKTEKEFIFYIKKAYNNCEVSDTNNIPLFIHNISESKKYVSNMLKKISQYELVITDRLHGMIFSVITRTSCIVIKTYNHKISSSYEWFNYLDYVKFLNSNNINEFNNLINYFKNKNTDNIYNKKHFDKYYNIIRQILNNNLK